MLLGMSNPESSAERPGTGPELGGGLKAASGRRLGWLLAALGAAGLLIASVSRPADAGSAAAQDWSPFVLVAGLLLIGALTLVITNYKQVHEINIFAFVLVVQSLPFLSAVAIATIEGTRFNSFAYWRGIEARIESKAADLLPQSQQVMTNVMAAPPKLPADNIEAAQ